MATPVTAKTLKKIEQKFLNARNTYQQENLCFWLIAKLEAEPTIRGEPRGEGLEFEYVLEGCKRYSGRETLKIWQDGNLILNLELNN